MIEKIVINIDAKKSHLGDLLLPITFSVLLKTYFNMVQYKRKGIEPGSAASRHHFLDKMTTSVYL